MQAGEDYSAADMAVYHAKRFLWKARVESIERLEHHVANALRELEKERVEADEAEKEAARKAGIEDA